MEQFQPQAAALSMEDWQARKDEAQAIHDRILQGLAGERVSAWFLAKQYHDLASTHGYYALGYDSLGEYLASAEVGVSRPTFMQYVAVWREFVERQALDPEDLQELSIKKLDLAAPGLRAGRSVREVVGDAAALSQDALKAKYRPRPESTSLPRQTTATAPRGTGATPPAAPAAVTVAPAPARLNAARGPASDAKVTDGTEGQTDNLSQPITAAVAEPLKTSSSLSETPPQGLRALIETIQDATEQLASLRPVRRADLGRIETAVYGLATELEIAQQDS
jgi:hypothetical protein